MQASFAPRRPGHIRVEGVAKRFGRVEALAPLAFEIAPGNLAALIAPNGSGKTTLLRILSGVVEPDAGTAVLAGAPPGRGAAGYVPAGDRGLYWRLSGRRNLEFFARIAGAASGDVGGVVAASAEALGAAALLTRRVGSCSTGERRRLAIARGFASRAPVMLLDEPYSDLDQPGRQAVERLCRRWTDHGGVVLYAAPIAEAGPAPDVVLGLDPGTGG